MLTSSSASRLLLCWQTVIQAPQNDRGALLPLVLEGRALKEARTTLTTEKKRHLAVSSGGEICSACRVEVISCQQQEAFEPARPTTIVQAKIMKKASSGTRWDVVEDVAVTLRRFSIGKEEGYVWKVTRVDLLASQK